MKVLKEMNKLQEFGTTIGARERLQLTLAKRRAIFAAHTCALNGFSAIEPLLWTLVFTPTTEPTSTTPWPEAATHPHLSRRNCGGFPR
jgi:hypothetical protein